MIKPFQTLGAALMAIVSCTALIVCIAPPALALPHPDGDRYGCEHDSVTAVHARQIYTMSNTDGVAAIIENGIVLIRGGKIVTVGRECEVDVPLGARSITFPDGVLIPGLVNAAARSAARVAGDETVSAKYRAIDTFDPYSKNSDLLSGGVTTTYLAPDTRRLVSGQGAVVKTAGPCRISRILAEDGDLCLNLGSSAHRPPPLQDYPLPAWSLTEIPPAAPQRPYSRISQYLELRAAFEAAGDYGRRLEAGRIAYADFDYNLEVLHETLANDTLLRIRALRAVDIEGALRLLRELKMKGYLTGCHEAHELVKPLAAAGVGAVIEIPFRRQLPLGEIGIDPGRIDERLDTVARLAAGGVQVALTAGQQNGGGELLHAAALAVRGGLSEEGALRAITRTPAELLGVAQRVGSLEPGRDADIVVLSAAPFRLDSHVRQVFIGGRSVFVNPMGRDALVVRAGKILTAAGPAITNGEVLVEQGVIRAVGKTVPHPPGARIVDEGPDSVVTPGFIDAHGHLGLEGDRSTPGPDVVVANAVVVEQPNFHPVARAGVTTVVMAPYGSHRSGSQVAAIKTAGRGRDQMVTDDLAAIKMSFGGQDPLLGLDVLRKPLKKGKDYADKWTKYYEDLKKWQEEQAKKKAEAEKQNGQAEAEKKPAADEKGKGAREKIEKEEKETVDPLSGTWEGKIEGDPLPEPADITLKLKLDSDGSSVSGSVSNPMSPEEVAVDGTLSGTQLTLTVDVETPMGAPTVEATLDRADHMVGMVKVGSMFSLDFQADRTEKEAPVIKISTRKKKVDDGKPQPPKVKPDLEPYRRLFAGEVPLLVEANRAEEIEAVIKVVVGDYKVPLVLLGGTEAYKLKQKITEAKTGVVLALPLQMLKERKPYFQAVDLSRSGIAVMFQSNAEDGARNLPDMAGFAIGSGMDASAALEALTISPAKLYHIDDRVGSLQAGRDGDLVVFSGDPFERTSRVLRVFVAGKEVEP